jgi:hypothetical protein
LGFRVPKRLSVSLDFDDSCNPLSARESEDLRQRGILVGLKLPAPR